MRPRRAPAAAADGAEARLRRQVLDDDGLTAAQRVAGVPALGGAVHLERDAELIRAGRRRPPRVSVSPASSSSSTLRDVDAQRRLRDRSPLRSAARGDRGSAARSAELGDGLLLVRRGGRVAASRAGRSVTSRATTRSGLDGARPARATGHGLDGERQTVAVELERAPRRLAGPRGRCRARAAGRRRGPRRELGQQPRRGTCPRRSIARRRIASPSATSTRRS